MKKLLLIWLAAFAAVSCAQEKQPSKPLYMWFDCEANYATLSHPDSIRYYVSKIHDMGFTDVVVDVKSIMGETLYKSDIAPYMGEWEGVTRPENYDLLGYFIEEGHKLGMRVHGSLNVFAGGHNYFDRGIIYGDHADWQSQVYTEGKIVPISEIKSNYNGMLNPANPEVQEYELAILKEFAGKYPDVDGIVFDRVRFDNITSDFSPLSKELFEAYAGTKVADYPGDILRWTQDADGKWSWSQGPLFRKWIEWRASVIKDFVTEAHRQLKEINPRLLIGDYTGAWYPTYYYVGVNWASPNYDTSSKFSWATKKYMNYGYADLMDQMLIGAYASPTRVYGTTEWTMQGFCLLAKERTMGACPMVAGGPDVGNWDADDKVPQEEENRAITASVAACINACDGYFLFDMIHLKKADQWSYVKTGIDGVIKKD